MISVLTHQQLSEYDEQGFLHSIPILSPAEVARFRAEIEETCRALGGRVTRLDGPHLYFRWRSEEHTSELQSQFHLVCRLLLEKKKIMHLIDVCQRRNDFFEAKEIVRLMLTLFLFVIVSQRDCDLYRCSFTLACSVRLLPHVSP